MDKEFKKKGRPKKGEIRFDLAKAIDLRMQGKSIEKIAGEIGIAKSSLEYHFKKLSEIFNNKEILGMWDKNRNNFLKAVEVVLGSEFFDRTKLKKASINNLAYAFRQIYECGRLEMGKSTANISYADMILEKKRLNEEEQEILMQLKELKEEWNISDDEIHGTTDNKSDVEKINV